MTAEIEAIIGLDDPVGIGGPDNVGEYTPEAMEIAARLPVITSKRELQAAIHEIFQRMFDPRMTGSIEQYESITRRVWALRHKDG